MGAAHHHFHRHGHHDDKGAMGVPLDEADYDAQRDLAGASTEHSSEIAFNPYAESVDPGRSEPAYDVDRDTAS